jgi:LAO/AO transport system kinase
MVELARRVLQGDLRAATRLMREVEDGAPEAIPALQLLFPHTGRAHVIGITGAPGAGKSTLTDGLVALFRAANLPVGVLAVDPTSPFTGGAILGDRVRMQAHATDPDVFIRSLATRGHLGGLSRATGDCIRIMDAMGKPLVLVETVGVGQDEVEIAGLSHTAVVVLTPGMGDDIQAIKSGILEVADIFVVNKADRDGADRTVRELQTLLELRRIVHGPVPASEWEPPILKTEALRGEGLPLLKETLDRHRVHLERTGQRAVRDRGRAKLQLMTLLKDALVRAAFSSLDRQVPGGLEALAVEIAEKRQDPYDLARELAERLA